MNRQDKLTYIAISAGIFATSLCTLGYVTGDYHLYEVAIVSFIVSIFAINLKDNV